MIAVTDLALEKIQEILKEEPDDNVVIRVNVSPGWGGMKFHLVLDEPREHDRILEVRGLKFAIDAFAASFIESVTVDFDEYEDSFMVINEAGPTSAC